MKPAVVVDIGNSRIKWGRCRADGIAESVSLPADDVAAWQAQRERWELPGNLAWVVSSVDPPRREMLVRWLGTHAERVLILEDWRQLSLRVLLEHPEWVGIDRLLDAVAANSRRPPGTPAVLVDAGSAVTVDWVNETGAFCGGAILPGLRLMAKSLHNYTALLPFQEVRHALPPMPGTSTPAAMETGIYWAVAGGIRSLVDQLKMLSDAPAGIWLTGGDAHLLSPALGPDMAVWPDMTLEGIRLAAESLP